MKNKKGMEHTAQYLDIVNKRATDHRKTDTRVEISPEIRYNKYGRCLALTMANDRSGCIRVTGHSLIVSCR